MNTGSAQFGRPSMGAWVTYGIGTRMQRPARLRRAAVRPARAARRGRQLGQRVPAPTVYQGVPFRSTGDPIVNLSTPAGIGAQRQRQTIDAVRELNLKRLVATGDPEIATRISQYEMAYRMQTSAPELIDLSGETQETLDALRRRSRQAELRQQLPARPPAGRARRAVRPALPHQLGQPRRPGREPRKATSKRSAARSTRPCAALVMDLKQRGLLDDTLVVWGGEFGRTPMGESRDTTGRNHHIDAPPCGSPAAASSPATSSARPTNSASPPTEDPVHVHDLHATILHLLGLEHTRLTFRFQGRDFRLTDVAGKVIEKLLV